MVLGTLPSSPTPPTAHSAFCSTALKPKQAKAGQDDLTICLRGILATGDYCCSFNHIALPFFASPEPKQVWAEFDGPVGIAGVQTERYLSL